MVKNDDNNCFYCTGDSLAHPYGRLAGAQLSYRNAPQTLTLRDMKRINAQATSLLLTIDY